MREQVRRGDDCVADNYFDKTQRTFSRKLGSVLFITDEGASFQIKGRIEYLKDGPVFDDMKMEPDQASGTPQRR